jgi:hypothetical protein
LEKERDLIEQLKRVNGYFLARKQFHAIVGSWMHMAAQEIVSRQRSIAEKS